MIYGVAGTPGAGKSWYAVRKVCVELLAGKCVASNVLLEPGWSRALATRTLQGRLFPAFARRVQADLEDRYAYVRDLDELMEYQLASQEEGAGIAVLDEAHTWLNSRLWAADIELRQRYVDWFSIHRHEGWDVYLISQHIDSVDKQVRDRIEYHVRLRNFKKAKIAGIPLSPVDLFLAVHTWNGGSSSRRHVSKREWFMLDSRADLYKTRGLRKPLIPGRPTLPHSARLDP